MYAELPNLELIQEKFHNEIKEKLDSNYNPEFDLTMFSQIWGSTALGFDGVGGSAMTKAYTTVIREIRTSICGVFFNERLAYVVEKPNELFTKDINNFSMESCHNCNKYK